MYIEIIISIDNTYAISDQWCYHLSLDCLQEARIHSGLLLLSLVMEYLVAHQTNCPSATCKRCPRDVVVFSGSQPEKSPRSSPAPRPCHSPPSSQTQCGLSLVESGTATWPAQDNTTRPVLVTWQEWECAVGWCWCFSYLSLVVDTWGHRQVSSHVWRKNHL